MTALYDVPAPAKLNLFLHIIGRRADGYHLLQSVFELIDWVDVLHFERRDDGHLARHDLGTTLPEDDLCLRAARALQLESATALGADISIDKRVPWGAGMGGGSSDAASTLLALNRLWGLHWPRERLAALGLRLGADVPFFIGGHPAFVEGIGEKLTPVVLPPSRYAVVKPAAALSTREIFGHPQLVRSTDPVILAGSPEEAGRSDLPPDGLKEFVRRAVHGYGRNDLQPPAEDRCPEVAQATRWLEARYGNSRMTGSGSAVFARDDTVETPLAAFPAKELPPGWVGRQCRSLSEHPLAGWAS
ncbi:MAG: 4-(cytidine 5'-diphospho)-2-C-methyl-D-erythritol kinase [Rubrivivax sp.]|nr:4-(cytidine 5'-diphospho)-2-C-methyl-D-erythritol kinase [Rubrivivax sp.]